MGRAQLCGFGTSFESKRWLSLDPCGTLGIGVSYAIHFYALLVIYCHLISTPNASFVSKWLYYFVYVPIFVLALWSLVMASTTDPGAVPMGARPLVKVRRAASTLSQQQDSSSNDTTTTNSNNDNDINNSNNNPTTEASATATRGKKGGGRRGGSAAEAAIRRCHKCCDNYKPPRAHHDSVTGRCIVKMDHFCPWVNNAVGALNHKFFCLFLMYTAMSCLLSILFLLIRLVQCGYVFDDETNDENLPPTLGAKWSPKTISSSAVSTLTGSAAAATSSSSSSSPNYVYPECHSFFGNHYLLGLLIASLAFFIFCVSMGCEQIDAIETGRGKIARMKMSIGQSGTEFQAVTTEFNEMFGGESPNVQLHWFLPWKPVVFPRGMHKVVLGYEWDESFDCTQPYAEDQQQQQQYHSSVSSSSLSSPQQQLPQHLQIRSVDDALSSASAAAGREMIDGPHDDVELGQFVNHSISFAAAAAGTEATTTTMRETDDTSSVGSSSSSTSRIKNRKMGKSIV